MGHQSMIVYSSRGNAYQLSGQFDQAVSDYSKALEIMPQSADTYKNRGSAHLKNKKYNQAIEDFNKAIAINSGFAESYLDRGNAYLYKGQYNQAISDYSKAIAMDQASAFPYASLAWLLATCPNEKYRNGSKAIELAQKAIRISLHPNNLASLAAGYAEIGKFNEAIATQKKLIAILKQEGKTENLNDFMEKPDAYISHKPWREEVK